MRVVQHCRALGIAVTDPDVGARILFKEAAKSSAAMLGSRSRSTLRLSTLHNA
jgi:hypothetical protein